MSFGVGCDVEEISRFEKYAAKEEFLKQVCLPSEKEYCQSKARPQQHLAAIFCGKEAVIKALGNLEIDNIGFWDIEISHLANGCPQVRILKDMDCDLEIKISLSHCKTVAMAQVVAFRS